MKVFARNARLDCNVDSYEGRWIGHSRCFINWGNSQLLLLMFRNVDIVVIEMFMRLHEISASSVLKLFAIEIVWFADRPWSNAMTEAAEYGHLSVLVWLCNNGEPCTEDAFLTAMHSNNLPMLKFMVHSGRAVRAGCQSFKSEDSFLDWIDDFSDRNLAVLAYIFDTIFGGVLSAACMKGAVRQAIESHSVLALRWLQQKGVHMNVARAKQYTVQCHSEYLNTLGVRRLLDWLNQVTFCTSTQRANLL